MKLVNISGVSTFIHDSELAAKKAKTYSTLQQELTIIRDQ